MEFLQIRLSWCSTVLSVKRKKPPGARKLVCGVKEQDFGLRVPDWTRLAATQIIAVWGQEEKRRKKGKSTLTSLNKI